MTTVDRSKKTTDETEAIVQAKLDKFARDTIKMILIIVGACLVLGIVLSLIINALWAEEIRTLVSALLPGMY